MNFKSILLLFLSIFSLKVSAQSVPAKNAREIVRQSLKEIGGSAWDTIKTLSFEGYGYRNSIEQSERPDGPYVPVQFSRSITVNLPQQRAEITNSELLYNFKSSNTFIFNQEFCAERTGKQFTPVQPGQELEADLFSLPFNVLKKALEAPDLIFVKDTSLQAAQNSVIQFRWNKYPVRLYINKETALPTAVEVIRPFQNDFLNIWGDTKRINYYSFWMLLGKNLHYPLQQDTYVNGWYKSSFLINGWKINPAIDTTAMTIPAVFKISSGRYNKAAKQQYEKLLSGSKQHIADGITLINGPCNTTVVEQEDGLVVIESPSSSLYGEVLAKEIRKQYPGKKIKALVTTSDAWLHIGGIRAFASIPEIQIYYPYRNHYIINKLLTSTYVTNRDTFSKISSKDYHLTGVKDHLAVGKGKNEIILYPYQTETGDRMMMVWFPQQSLLYASDLYQPKDQNGIYWNPHIAWEVYQSIKKLKLPVNKFYAMHSDILDFSTIENDFGNPIR